MFDITLRPNGKGESTTIRGVLAKDKNEAALWAYNIQLAAGWPAEKPGYSIVAQEAKVHEEDPEDE